MFGRVVKLVRGLPRRGESDPLDKQVFEALTRTLKPDSNCIDVGAHRGVILDHIVRLAPLGQHTAIEPLPGFASDLRVRFPQVTVYEVALADENGSSEFQYVVTNPAYSGLRLRRYDRPNERLQTIHVAVRRLDDLVEPSHRVDVMKIDAEGGELGVLSGARRILSGRRPMVLFEHGLGAADYYGTKPDDVYALLTEECGMDLFTLSGWLSRNRPLDLTATVDEFLQCREYMFVAVPREQHE